MTIRCYHPDDAEALWALLEPVIREGATYAIDRALPREDALAYWTGAIDDRRAFVMEEEGQVVGTYYLRTNQPGGGSHVCNCGYVTAPAARGRGLARRMAEHSFQSARLSGYRAMQYNFVVSTNEGAIRLWRDLGFAEVGRLPGAFAHPLLGYVDALVMYRNL